MVDLLIVFFLLNNRAHRIELLMEIIGQMASKDLRTHTQSLAEIFHDHIA